MYAAIKGHDAVVERLLAVDGERLDLNLQNVVSVIGVYAWVCVCCCVIVSRVVCVIGQR
jgi:hypothetical protein